LDALQCSVEAKLPEERKRIRRAITRPLIGQGITQRVQGFTSRSRTGSPPDEAISRAAIRSSSNGDSPAMTRFGLKRSMGTGDGMRAFKSSSDAALQTRMG